MGGDDAGVGDGYETGMEKGHGNGTWAWESPVSICHSNPVPNFHTHLPGRGLKESGVDPPFRSSRACLHTAFIAQIVQCSLGNAHKKLLLSPLAGVRELPFVHQCTW